jgi:hypothetical protein
MLKLIYAPMSKSSVKRFLFYADYLCYIARFSFREIDNIVHDHLTASVAFYISRQEFAGWFNENAVERPEIHWHNQNSWRGSAHIKSSMRAEAGHEK